MKFDANHKYALIGKSGIGKSTLLKIINQELTPTKGHVYFVNNNSEKFSLSNLQENISYVSSDDHVFNESLFFNLTLGKSIQKSDIDNALERVYLKDWVETLPQGLNTILSQTKLDISSGQKQRIMLARLFLEDKPIWLIDEGTSAIDEQIRKEIEREILKDRSKTVLFVTHHLNDELAYLFDECIDFNALV